MRSRAALFAVVVGLVGCGADEAPEQKPNGVRSVSPAKAVKAASDALGDVRSFRMDGFQVDSEDGRLEFELAVVLPGRVRFVFREKGTRVEVIAISGEAWMNASREFWSENSPDTPGVARLLAGRWVRMPSSSVRELQFFLNIADPDLVGRCLIGYEFGRLRRGKTAKVGGRGALIIRDAGKEPGTAPGDLYLATVGPPLPLHFRQTGPEKPGGKRDPVCTSSDADDSTTLDAEYRFRDYNEDIEIEPPKDVLDLERLLEQADPGSPA